MTLTDTIVDGFGAPDLALVPPPRSLLLAIHCLVILKLPPLDAVLVSAHSVPTPLRWFRSSLTFLSCKGYLAASQCPHSSFAASMLRPLTAFPRPLLSSDRLDATFSLATGAGFRRDVPFSPSSLYHPLRCSLGRASPSLRLSPLVPSSAFNNERPPRGVRGPPPFDSPTFSLPGDFRAASEKNLSQPTF